MSEYPAVEIDVIYLSRFIHRTHCSLLQRNHEEMYICKNIKGHNNELYLGLLDYYTILARFTDSYLSVQFFMLSELPDVQCIIYTAYI